MAYCCLAVPCDYSQCLRKVVHVAGNGCLPSRFGGQLGFWKFHNAATQQLTCPAGLTLPQKKAADHFHHATCSPLSEQPDYEITRLRWCLISSQRMKDILRPSLGIMKSALFIDNSFHKVGGKSEKKACLLLREHMGPRKSE
eukprot:1146018-Pelagomonas_calceolata.AAC.1